MSNANIFKIKMLQPSFFQQRPQTANRVSASKKSQQASILDISQCQLTKPSSRYLKPSYVQNQIHRKDSKNKQIEILQSFRSQASCRSHRSHKLPKSYQSTTLQPNKKCKFIQVEIKNNKKQRPQSAMMKRTRKRSWNTNNTKVPIFNTSQIIFKKNQVLQQHEMKDCVVFFKRKCIFARIIKSRDDLQWQPISNQYIVKIFGRIQINSKLYFIMQNFNKSSIREIIDSFGPCKQSLIRKQIRSLVVGVIHCHSRGIIHNRINPDTIYLNQQCNYLIDITQSSSKEPNQQQKQKYFHYFAPQLLISSRITEACDVWSVGCLTLQLLTNNIQGSFLHPYNQQADASPSADPYQLKNLRQQSKKYCSILQKQIQQSAISKVASSFIKACLKVNDKSRPQLAFLIDHQFLRFNC